MKKNAFWLTALVTLASVPSSVAASSPARLVAVCASGATNFFGFQPWYACLQTTGPYGTGDPKITSLNDIFLIIFPLVDSLVKVAVLVAVGIIMFMFIKMIFSNGNSSEVAKAALGIRDAAVGLIISLVSIAIINFVSGAFKP